MFPILNLSGNGFERGYAYGTKARTQIARTIRCYAALFAASGIDWKKAQTHAAAFRDVIVGCGDVMDEIDGIAAGSGFHINEILALNCRTEILPPAFLEPNHEGGEDARVRNRLLGILDIGECTSFAIDRTRCADQATRIGQNWDWIGYQRENVVILRVTREGGMPDFITLTEAGIVAKIGVNARGLAIGLNILRANNDRQSLGVPVHVFQRMALDLENVNMVTAFASALKFCASSNAILGDASGRIASLEYSPGGVALVEPEHGVIAHTNHFCDPMLARDEASLA
ncbi:MAG: C45 family autoproteolytic acyltransferase/hydrolase, partial [Casimicrobium sp.]